MKKLLIGIGVVIVAVVILLVVAVYNIGPMIKKAVNSYGPDITKTEMKVDNVDVGLFGAEATIGNFLLGNPEGFDSPKAMSVGSIHVNINEKTITQDTIVIDKISVMAPELNYEIQGKTDNFRAILNNVREATGAKKAPPEEKAPEPTGDKKPGKKILIKDFSLTNGQINLHASGLRDKNVQAKLPDIHLTDIGGGEGGVLPAEAVRVIMDAIYKEIQSSAVREALNRQLKELGMSLDKFKLDAKGAVDKLQQEAEGKIKDKVKGLFQ